MSPTLAEEVTPQNDGSVIIDGTANVREINKAFNWHLPEDDARTVNGVILEALEEILSQAPACVLASTILIFSTYRTI